MPVHGGGLAKARTSWPSSRGGGGGALGRRSLRVLQKLQAPRRGRIVGHAEEARQLPPRRGRRRLARLGKLDPHLVSVLLTAAVDDPPGEFERPMHAVRRQAQRYVFVHLEPDRALRAKAVEREVAEFHPALGGACGAAGGCQIVAPRGYVEAGRKAVKSPALPPGAAASVA